MQGEEHELKRANLEDRIDTLVCLLGHYSSNHTHKSLDGFQQYIEDFFKEDPRGQIILSTGHRAKGLEFPRVFMYVMYTRVRYMREVLGSGTLFLGVSKNV